MSVDDSALLRRSFDVAKAALAKGNQPFGAVLALGDQIIAEAENEIVTTRDPTRHAELVLISEATRRLAPEVLAQATLYASTEPCAMCASAIVWSGIRRVVYGCPAEDLAALAGQTFVVPSREVFARSGLEIQVIGPSLKDEALAVHNGVWG